MILNLAKNQVYGYSKILSESVLAVLKIIVETVLRS